MSTPKPEHEQPRKPAGEVGAATSGLPLSDDVFDDSPAVRILIVEPETKTRRAIATLLRAKGYECDPMARKAEALGAISGAEYDVAIIGLHLREGSGNDLLRAVHERSNITKVIMLGNEPMLDQAVTAMRLGAVDLLARPINEAETIASVNNAIELARQDRARELRLQKLQRLCNVLSRSRAAEAKQVGALCRELETTCDQLNDQVKTLKLASEFKAMIEQELDIEALLRSSLEFMLRKTGPTNAAVYLPSNHSDYSLGAYVNYDCPRDTADVLLDHLADVLAPQFDDIDHVLVLNDDRDLEEHLGDDANWLADSRVIIFACRHKDECLAVVTFFRDREKPFPEDLLPQLVAMKDIFAQQLAKVIRVHHRAIVDKEDWLGADDADDYGLAA